MELAVRWTGQADGVPVLVLHGFTGCAQAMAPLTERLAAGNLPRPALRVIAPDLVGHGDSDSPDDLDLYRVEAMAAQVLAVADALDCDTFHLVGYSMGGRVALTLGCTAPQRLRSLTLIGASAGISDPAERSRRAEADRSRAERIAADFPGFVDEWMAGPLFAGQAALGEAHLRAARAERLASNPQGLACSLMAGGTGAMEPLHERLVDCDAPTLLVVGARDSKFCAVADQLAAALPRAALAHIDGAGHAAHVEQPEATAAAIAEFIAGTEALPAGSLASMPAAVARPALIEVEAHPVGEGDQV
ncbi:MAG: alpha/beta fold hydrolase [Acidimicrobiia bacterium]|nr:alpha/beta fold hydrolase [Acidimicrobiia bacterium]